MRSISTQAVVLMAAAILVCLSLWGFLAAPKYSPTALIPAGFGAALALLHRGVRAGNRLATAFAAVLCLVVAVALTTPLQGVVDRGDPAPIFRVGAMLLASAAACVVLVRRFLTGLRRGA